MAAPLRSALPAPLPERGGHSITSRVRFAGCSPDPFRFAPGLRLPLPPLTLPERPSLWLWGWERRERSDRRPQPQSLTAASVGSPEGQSPFGPSAAETNPLASGEALTPRERSDRQQGAKRSAGGTARASAASLPEPCIYRAASSPWSRNPMSSPLSRGGRSSTANSAARLWASCRAGRCRGS